jgi:hypothetical protein
MAVYASVIYRRCVGGSLIVKRHSAASALELHRTPVELHQISACIYKGTIMKRIASLLSAVAIATAAGSAIADSPSSANETTSLSSIFPQIRTYADLHRNDLAKQESVAGPSSANETTSMASEFPRIVTYADLHRSDVVKQASSPFPSSVNETTSLSSTFPQMTTYADLHRDNVKRASSGNGTSSM